MTAVHTSKSVHEVFGVTTLDQEYPELETPVEVGNQRQGDVYVLRVTTDRKVGAIPVGPKGVVVVRAETSASNTHTLYSVAGDCLWLANQTDDLVEGWLTVPPGGEAFLLHTSEHSAIGIGEGTFEIRRQREYAGEWRRVAD